MSKKSKTIRSAAALFISVLGCALFATQSMAIDILQCGETRDTATQLTTLSTPIFFHGNDDTQKGYYLIFTPLESGTYSFSTQHADENNLPYASLYTYDWLSQQPILSTNGVEGQSHVAETENGVQLPYEVSSVKTQGGNISWSADLVAGKSYLLWVANIYYNGDVYTLNISGGSLSTPVSDLACTKTTSCTADLAWAAPTDASSVKVQYKVKGQNVVWSDGDTVDPSAAGTTVTGLKQNTEYEFRLSVTGGMHCGYSNFPVAQTPMVSAPKITSPVVPTHGYYTQNTSVDITGTADPGVTIGLSGTSRTTTADADGKFTLSSVALMENAVNKLSVTATDAANNSNSITLNIIQDDAPPDKPSVFLSSDSDKGISSTDGITNATKPTLTGTAEADSTVTIYDGTDVLGTAAADSSTGSFAFTPQNSLTDGQHSITATATDRTGNVSDSSDAFSVTIDTKVPDSPTIELDAASDSGVSDSDGITNVTKPVFTGTAEAGSTVTIYDGDILFGVTASNGSTESFAFTPQNALADGQHSITATVADAAGNISAASTAVSVTIETKAPDSPTIELAAASDSGVSDSDGITNVTKPVFTGTAETDSTVTIYDGTDTLGITASKGSIGAFTFTPKSALADGRHSITAMAADKAGNVSAASAAVSVMVDRTAPTLSSAEVSTGTCTDTSVSLSWTQASDVVTSQENLLYKVYRSATSLADLNDVENSTLCNSTDALSSYTASGLVPNTSYYFYVIVSDAAGNESLYAEVTGTTSAPTTIPVTGITVTGPSSFTSGGSVQMSATATPSDATDQSVIWSVKVKSGSFSAGSITGGGLLSATGSGVLTITATAVDGSGTVGSADITVGVAPKISTTSLPAGTVGTAYIQTLSADGDATVIWRLTSGSLPDGLALGQDGAISGTPAKAGNFTFTVQAASDFGDDTEELSIHIDPAGSDKTYGISLDQNGTYAFTSQTAGYSPVSPLTVNVTNTGTQATGDLTVALNGSNAESFTLSKTMISSIAASGSDSFTVGPNGSLSNGTYTATVTVSGGNVTTQSFTVSFTVGTAAANVQISITQSPIKSILHAITFGLFFDDTIDVSVTSTGLAADHYEYQIVANGDAFDANGTWTQGASFSIDPDFKGRVYARAVCSGGGTSEYTYEALVVDTTRPEITANNNASSGSVEVGVNDSGAGIDTITYQVGADAEQSINLEPSETRDITTRHDFTISNLPDGQYDVVIDATDNSGNAADTKTVSIDTGPAVVDAAISPAAKSYDLASPGDASTTITWNSASSVTGVVYDADSSSLRESDDYVATGSVLAIKSSYLQTMGLSDGDSAKFTISFDVGNPVTFTVDFEDSHTPSDNADLSDLTVNGTTVTGFDPDTTDYDVELPHGTLPGSAAATVGAETDDSHATVVITQANSLPGTTTVEVTAEDTSSSKEYKIHFTLANPTPATHSVTVQNDGHGTGSADPASAAAGTEIILTATPVSGYHFAQWRIISPTDLSVTGDTFTMPDEAVTVKAVFEQDKASSHTVTVTGGTGGGDYSENDTVTLTADSSPDGQQFKEWSITPVVTFVDGTDKTDQTAKFTMPDGDVTATATYEPIPVGTILVTGVTLSRTSLSLYNNTSPNTGTLTATVLPADAADKTVTWRSSKTAVATVDANGKVTAVGNGTATITVTTNDGGHTASCTVTVTTYSSGDSGHGSGSGNSGGSSGSATTTPPLTAERRPNLPVTGVVSVTATAGARGISSATIPDQSVIGAIAKAQADAKAQGKTANGISVALNITAPQGTSVLSATLSQAALEALIHAGVANLEVNGLPVSVNFDQTALRAVRSQSSGNVTITAVARQNLSGNAKTMIGTRPVYNITVTYGSNSTVTNLGGGTATVSIPYTPARGEAAGYLYGVYVDGNGNATRINGSAYDANSGCLIFSTGHLSIYGVGYTAPSAKFTDISGHWAKDSIDYVVGRGLLAGASGTTFAPDTVMTRGMLVTALGRLAGVDTKLYTTNSFTDVKAGSGFQPYIEWAYQKGIVQGVGNSQFAPDRSVIREEIAVILQNYAKATGYTLPVTRAAVTFADDSSIGSAYRDAVKAMQQAGILLGGKNNVFSPLSGATRAEAASMLTRYIKLNIDPATAQGWAKNDAGQWMYFKDGKALTGWQNIDGKVYCFDSSGGAFANGWRQNAKGEWFYLSSDGSAVTGWKDISANETAKRYCFDANGVMAAGKWVEIDGKWYYFYADGSLAVSTTIDGYEIDRNGVRKTK